MERGRRRPKLWRRAMTRVWRMTQIKGRRFLRMIALKTRVNPLHLRKSVFHKVLRPLLNKLGV